MIEQQRREWLAELTRQLDLSRATVSRCLGELDKSGILAELARGIEEWRRLAGPRPKVRGIPAVYGSDIVQGMGLYALIRKHKPRLMIETGVCNGVSTTFILQAMSLNGRGKLHSIDYPEQLGKRYSPDHFWARKGGAAIPPGKKPGWMIPARLRRNWNLHLGRSQEVLPRLLKRLGTIDCFLHDSEHSYDCMMLEFILAYSRLSARGLLLSDDTDANLAFFDFARSRRKSPEVLFGRLGILAR